MNLVSRVESLNRIIENADMNEYDADETLQAEFLRGPNVSEIQTWKGVKS